MLIDQFEYMAEMAQRLGMENLTQLRKSFKEEKDPNLKSMKQAVMQETRSFLEVYQNCSINDYDYWDYKNAPMFSLFVDKFEKKAQELDGRGSQLLLGVVPEEGKYIFQIFKFLIFFIYY